MSLNSNVLQEQYYICQISDCVGNPVHIYNFRDLNYCQSHTICTQSTRLYLRCTSYAQLVHLKPSYSGGCSSKISGVK